MAQLDLVMFLHYAARDVPLESESGVSFPDIGADWVLSSETYVGHEGFGFSRSPQLRIPCP